MKFKKTVNKETRIILRNQLRIYEKAFSMTEEEHEDLIAWVAEGHSPYTNGEYVYFEDGCPMDFINALRWWNSIPEEFRPNLPNEGSDPETVLKEND